MSGAPNRKPRGRKGKTSAAEPQPPSLFDHLDELFAPPLEPAEDEAGGEPAAPAAAAPQAIAPARPPAAPPPCAAWLRIDAGV